MLYDSVRKSQIEDLTQLVLEFSKDHLPFELGEEQITALVAIFLFLRQKGFDEFVLSGPGGSGKSAITKLIVLYLEHCRIPYVLATPTNKACGVLQNYTERDVTTLHKLLTLKPTIDILNLDLKDLQWDSKTLNSGIPYNGVLIIDECSMINSVLYDFIKERASSKDCKVLYTGDSKQLYPVKERELSKPFKCEKGFFLNKIYRQKDDNPIMEILSDLREFPRSNFNEIRSNNGNLVLYNNWKSFLFPNIPLFKQAVDTQNTETVKLLAYTNKRVEAFNQVIRNFIFKNTEEYHIGEILMGYDNSSYKSELLSKFAMEFEIINSAEYIITGVTKERRQIGYTYFDGFILDLKPLNTEYSPDSIFIISRDTPEKDLASLAAYIELLRLDAIQAPSKYIASKHWKAYFSTMSSFTTPVDLSYGGRTVRKKTLDYGYALSVHKSQGSNYDNVLIDMDNLFICKNKEELRQLQYVALSRTRTNISMLIK